MSNRRVRYIVQSSSVPVKQLVRMIHDSNDRSNLCTMISALRSMELIIGSFADESEKDVVKEALFEYTDMLPKRIVNYRSSIDTLDEVFNESTLLDEEERGAYHEAMSRFAAGIEQEEGFRIIREVGRRVQVNLTERFDDSISWHNNIAFLNEGIYEGMNAVWDGDPNFDGGPFPWLQLGYVVAHAHWMLTVPGVLLGHIDYPALPMVDACKQWCEPAFLELKINPEHLVKMTPEGLAYSVSDMMTMAEKLHHSRATSLSKQAKALVLGMFNDGSMFAREIMNGERVH